MKLPERKILTGIGLLSLLVFLGACASQKKIVAKSKSAYSMDTKEDDDGGYDIIKTGSPVVLGPGPRLTSMDTNGPMEYIFFDFLDAEGKLVKSVELQALDKERLQWQAAWWMDLSEFKDGAEYRVFSRAKDIYGVRAVALKEGQSKVTATDRSAGDEDNENELSFAFRFRFSRTEPNPNLGEAWAEKLVKKYGKRP